MKILEGSLFQAVGGAGAKRHGEDAQLGVLPRAHVAGLHAHYVGPI